MGQALPKGTRGENETPGKFCSVIKVMMSPRGGETLKLRLRETGRVSVPRDIWDSSEEGPEELAAAGLT